MTEHYPRQIKIRIPDENEAEGYCLFPALLISPNIAISFALGCLEFLLVKTADNSGVYQHTASSEMIVFSNHDEGYVTNMLDDATTLTVSAFVEKYSELIFR